MYNSGYWDGHICLPCDSSCNLCNGPSSTSCLSCNLNYIFNPANNSCQICSGKCDNFTNYVLYGNSNDIPKLTPKNLKGVAYDVGLSLINLNNTIAGIYFPNKSGNLEFFWLSSKSTDFGINV